MIRTPTAAEEKASTAKLVVRQVRSGIGYNERQKATLKAMGLGRVGKRSRLPDNAQVRGMIAAVVHLVVIENAGPGDGSAARSRRGSRRA